MSEAVYQEVEHAIRDKLHVGVHIESQWAPSFTWRYPDSIVDGLIVMRDSDCGLAKPTFTWTPEEWAARVNSGGLWRKVGMWDFVRAEDAAADDIRYAHSNPEGAGRCLAEYRETTQSLRAQLAEKERECERLREWRAAVIAANDDEPHCIYCRGFLDTGMECNDCGRDNMPFYRALENDDG